MTKRKTKRKTRKTKEVRSMSKELYVFSTPTCPACRMVETQLKDARIPFTHIDCTDGSKETAELIEKCDVRSSVPVTTVYDKDADHGVIYWQCGSTIDMDKIKAALNNEVSA